MNSKQSSAAAATRSRLIDAALTVLEKQGGNQLTLDTVAKQANVSKGGLLHHFANKEALVGAVIRHLYELFNTRVQAYYDADSNPKGRWLRAYIRASFDEFEVPVQALVQLFSFVYVHDSLIALTQEDLSQWEGRFAEDGLSAARAAMIRMACDSYWTEQAMRMDSRVDSVLILEELIQLTL